jgi:hypothetical protein
LVVDEGERRWNKNARIRFETPTSSGCGAGPAASFGGVYIARGHPASFTSAVLSARIRDDAPMWAVERAVIESITTGHRSFARRRNERRTIRVGHALGGRCAMGRYQQPAIAIAAMPVAFARDGFSWAEGHTHHRYQGKGKRQFKRHPPRFHDCVFHTQRRSWN